MVQLPRLVSPITASTLPGVGRTISLQMVKMFWWQVKQNTKIGNVCFRRERVVTAERKRATIDPKINTLVNVAI